MLFSKETYIARRRALAEKVGNGLIVLFGNNESPMNYPANAYKFRQDSSFLYFFAHHRDGLVGVIDADTGQSALFGDEIDIDDIVWYGSVESVDDMAIEVGADFVRPMCELKHIVGDAVRQHRTIHFLPPYRHDTMIQIQDLLHIPPAKQKEAASLALIKAVVDLRSIKSDEEVAELKRAADIGYEMHTTAMRLCRPGTTEQFISGQITGIALSYGAGLSFGNIVSMHGEIMHGYPSATPLEAGRLLLCDAGAETNEHYCSDNTRTTPIGGKFTQKQRDIYQIVADCHDLAMQMAKPGVKYWDVHFAVCRLMTERLQALGLMKGDVDASLAAGAHALFLPHGLGHMMGMDVHDMEGLGQIYVGFDDETRPNLEQFGTNALRLGRRLQKGFVLTDEPGIYFIPQLIDLWKREGTNKDFLCFDKIEEYRDFGGIRIEDDLLITDDGCRIVGDKVIPYQPDDVEAFIAQNFN